MCVIRLYVLEGYVARFAVVQGFFLCTRLLLYFYSGDRDRDDWRRWFRLFLFRFIGSVNEPGVADDVAAVRGGVCAVAAAMDSFARGCWAGGCGLATVVFEDASYVAFFLELKGLVFSYGYKGFIARVSLQVTWTANFS